MAAATWAGVQVVLYRIHLYRTRHNPYGNGDTAHGP